MKGRSFNLSYSARKISVLVVIAFQLLSLNTLKAQGGNTCAAAASANLNFPFTISNFSTCNRGNDYTALNSCLSNIYYSGQDWYFGFVAPNNGFVTLSMTAMTYSNTFFACLPSITIFQGCPSTGGSCVGATFGNWAGTLPLNLTIQVTAGQQYFILMDSYALGNFYANCYTFSMNGSFQSIPVQPGCTNMGFDNNNFSGWVATSGLAVTAANGAPTPLYNMNNIGVIPGRHTIVTGGNDPCGGFPRVAPGGNGFSVRLGNNQTGAQAEQLRQTFMVTPSNASFTYKYAVVFEDAGHTTNQQPFFKALLRDQNGTMIQCSEFIVAAQVGLPGFINSTSCPNVRFKPWSTVNVDLTSYVGQPVTVEFTTGDCSQGGHFGYAYIDAACSPSTIAQNIDTICAGQSTTLQAPTGYQNYLWNPGNFNQQNVTVTPVQSTNYVLSATSFNGCVRTFNVPITVAPLPTAQFSYTAPSCNTPVVFTNTSTANSTIPITSYNWNFGPGAIPQTSNLPNPTVNFPNQGNYNVTLTVTNSAGCSNTVSQTITVPPCQFGILVTGGTVCEGQCITLQANAYNNAGAVSYQWSVNNASGSSLNFCPTQSQTIVTLTAVDAQGNTATDTAIVNIAQPTLLTSAIVNPLCANQSNGSLTISASGVGPFTYQVNGVNSASHLIGLSAGTYQIQATNAYGCLAATTATLINPAALNADINTQNATCNQNNGQLTVLNVSGGTSPYQFALYNGVFQSGNVFSNLSPGNYTIRVRDVNNCEISLNATVASGTLSQFSTQTTDATCDYNNGSINVNGFLLSLMPYQVSVNGGTSFAVNSSSYQLNQLFGGTYTIQITDNNGCLSTLNINLNQVTGPQAILSSLQAASCDLNNASLTLTQIQGGTAPYQVSVNGTSIALNQTLSNLSPNENFILQVSDANQCTFTTSVLTTAIQDLQISASPLSDPTCFEGNNGSALVSISGGQAPYQINWQNGESTMQANQLTAGNHQVTVTDATGCVRSASVTLSQPLPITATLTSISTTCNQSNGKFLITNVAGGTAPYQYSINSGAWQSIPEFDQLSPGDYTITIRDSNNCVYQINKSIEAIPVAQLNFTSTHATCDYANGSIMIDGFLPSGMPYSISNNNEASVQVYDFQHTIVNLYGNLYQLTIFDNNGCDLSSIVTLNQLSGPSQVSFSTVSATCGLNNGSATLHSISGGASPFIFQLNNSAVQLNQMVSNLQPNFEYQILIVDNNNCVYDTTFQILAIPDLTIQAQVINHPVCFQEASGIAGVTIVSGSAPFVYNWSNGSILQTASQLQAGNYTVTVTDSLGCQKTASVSLVNPDSIYAVVSIENATCGFENGEAIVMTTTGNWSDYTYSLNGNDWQTSPSFYDLNSGNHIFYVKNEDECVFQSSFSIEMAPYVQQLNVAIIDATCGLANATIQLSGFESGTLPGTLTFQNQSININSDSFVFSNLNAGVYQVSYIDANNCVVNSNITAVNIAGPSNLVYSVLDAKCGLANGEITIQGTTGGTSPYEYNFNQTGWGSETLFTNLAGGQYTISVIDSNNCQFTTSVQVEALPEMNVQAVIIEQLNCHNDQNAKAQVNIQSGFAPYLIQWSNGAQTPQLTDLSAGTYSVSVTDSLGCVKSSTLTIANPSPFTVQITAPDTVCSGSQVNLIAQASEEGSHISYIWNIGYHPGQSLVLVVDSLTECSVIASNLVGCSDTDTVQIAARTLPTAVLNSSIPEGCAPLCTSLSMQQLSSQVNQVTWFSNQLPIGTLYTQPLCFNEDGVFTIQARIKDIYGCENQINLSQPVHVFEKPVADFDFTPEAPNSLDKKVQFMNRSSSFYSSKWTFGNFGSSTLTHPEITYPDTGTYTNCLTVETEHGCVNKICKQLKIEPVETLYAPTAFSPNDDGINDNFTLKGQYINSVRLEVFNRWGEIIYTGDGYTTGWDGTLNGSKVQNDLYVWRAYVVFTTNQTNSMTGVVQVVE